MDNKITMFDTDFIAKINNMLVKIVTEEELPPMSLHLYANISSKTKEEVSKSICIYEPDYPEVKSNLDNLGRNFVVMNMQGDDDSIELLIRPKQFQTIVKPPLAIVKDVPSDTKFMHIVFNKKDDALLPYIQKNIMYCLDHYKSKAKSFGCCSQFIKCSDVKKCVHVNKLYSKACAYRQHLDAGEIFYGKNKNI